MTPEEPWAAEFAPRARRQLRRLSPRDIEQVFAAVERLASRAPNVDLRKLEGFEEEWAIRSGDWKIRLRFRHADHTIDVLQVLHRREAYRDR